MNKPTETQELTAQWLIDQQIPTFNPTVGKTLLDIVEILDKRLSTLEKHSTTESQELVLDELIEYRNALYTVAHCSALQQGLALVRLSKSIQT